MPVDQRQASCGTGLHSAVLTGEAGRASDRQDAGPAQDKALLHREWAFSHPTNTHRLTTWRIQFSRARHAWAGSVPQGASLHPDAAKWITTKRTKAAKKTVDRVSTRARQPISLQVESPPLAWTIIHRMLRAPGVLRGAVFHATRGLTSSIDPLMQSSSGFRRRGLGGRGPRREAVGAGPAWCGAVAGGPAGTGLVVAGIGRER